MTDAELMHRALALAERGRGAVEPNPLVGAVVVDAAGTTVGEGWHQQFGQAHAEVPALLAAGDRTRGGTLYATLEPCCHHGKTPPCTDRVLRSGVRRVVVAMADPFPRVDGGGIAILRAAGIAVDVGLCETDARRLNAPYLKLLAMRRPWVHLKWAMTLDGKIATRRGDSQWISNEASRRIVHELRGRMDAILIGRGTLIADDPLLTARPAGPRTPVRVVVTASGLLPETCRLLTTANEAPVIVFTTRAQVPTLARWTAAGCEVVGLPSLSIDAILADLGQRRMTNILVEGGAGLLGSFLDAGAADEAHIFIAPKLLGGATAPGPVAGAGVAGMGGARALLDTHVTAVENDLYLRGRFR